MKFLVDESVEYSLVLYLRNLDFNTLSIAEKFPSLEDEKVLKIANKEKRIVITNDKDFGELVFYQKKKHRGVILFRLREEDASSKICRLDKILKKFKRKLKDRFVVISPTKVRFRKT
ncbi:DUF5615 family PIN-like protein [Candidatus Microgenomates bacterium]|nr:DUF5615 family PIN-like protein [Candidatus Microgenomates bacterium]